MVFKSFSKINFSLNVNKKASNGLYNIQSYYCLVNLFDEIKITKINKYKDKVEFQGKFSSYVKKSKNSVLESLKILRKNKLISNFYLVTIKKKIPVFSGLGGGTSNAFYLVKKLIKKRINKKIVHILEKKIGSDFRLFFSDQGFLQNLKKVNSFKKKYRLFFLLVYPNIKCSTREVYLKNKKVSSKFKYDFKSINTKKKFMTVILNKSNDLQSTVEKKHPIIRNLLAEIARNKGCYFSRMTGSGSVCYGVFQSEKRAKSAVNKIKLKYPRFWISFAKTI